MSEHVGARERDDVRTSVICEAVVSVTASKRPVIGDAYRSLDHKPFVPLHTTETPPPQLPHAPHDSLSPRQVPPAPPLHQTYFFLVAPSPLHPFMVPTSHTFHPFRPTGTISRRSMPPLGTSNRDDVREVTRWRVSVEKDVDKLKSGIEEVEGGSARQSR